MLNQLTGIATLVAALGYIILGVFVLATGPKGLDIVSGIALVGAAVFMIAQAINLADLAIAIGSGPWLPHVHHRSVGAVPNPEQPNDGLAVVRAIPFTPHPSPTPYTERWDTVHVYYDSADSNHDLEHGTLSQSSATSHTDISQNTRSQHSSVERDTFGVAVHQSLTASHHPRSLISGPTRTASADMVQLPPFLWERYSEDTHSSGSTNSHTTYETGPYYHMPLDENHHVAQFRPPAPHPPHPPTIVSRVPMGHVLPMQRLPGESVVVTVWRPYEAEGLRGTYASHRFMVIGNMSILEPGAEWVEGYRVGVLRRRSFDV